MRRAEVIGLICGLGTFLLGLLALRFGVKLDVSRWDGFLLALGWVAVVAFAAWETRGWLAPILIASGEVLQMVAERFFTLMLLQQETRMSPILIVAIMLLILAGSLTLWVAGGVLVIRAVSRRMRAR